MADRRLYRPSWAAWTSLILHGVWLVVFGYVAVLGPSGRVVDVLGYRIWLPRCQTCDAASDSLRTAAEMGRLEIVSIALTVLGVLLALAAIGGFLNIRSAAIWAATSEAGDQTPAIVRREMSEDVLVAILRSNGDILTSAVRRVMREGDTADVSPEQADTIAGTYGSEAGSD